MNARLARLAHAVIAVVAAMTTLALPTARAEEAAGLDDVANVDRFPGDAAARERLARDGIVVLPRYNKQIFSPYIGRSLPPYITVDSAHATYHVLYEASLREIEVVLATGLREEVAALTHRLVSEMDASGPKELGPARRLAAGWAAVGARLLGLQTPALPDALESLVQREVALVQSAGGPVESPLFGVREDYGAYQPRGAYEGNPEREAYFRAVSWFGRRGFRVIDDRETAAAVLVTRAELAEPKLAERHAASAALLDWLVGPADDLDIADYRDAAVAVLGAGLADAAIVAKLPALRSRLAGLRDPEINAQLLSPGDWTLFREKTKGLRLLPARRTADAWLFQQLADAFPSRQLPSGLDVALALGADQASNHLTAGGPSGEAVAERVRDLRPEFEGRLADTHYGATLQAVATLFDDESPLRGAGARDPKSGALTNGDLPLLPARVFASDAWGDRLLSSGLGGWASLRHAWLLHAKSNVNFMGATRDLPGVVEPAPRFFDALAALSRSLLDHARAAGAFAKGDPKPNAREVLEVIRFARQMALSGTRPTAEQMKLLEQHAGTIEKLMSGGGASPEMELARLERVIAAWLDGTGELAEDDLAALSAGASSKTEANLEELSGLLDRLAAIARTEIAGEDLSEQDAHFIAGYGKTIARLAFFEGNSWLDPGKQMGHVADVFSSPATSSVLTVGVGAPAEMYLVLPLRKGGRALYIGAVYTYYEFASKRRLTDSQWRRMVTVRSTPPMPEWTESFFATVDATPLVERIRRGEVVPEVVQTNDVRIGRVLLAVLRGEIACARPGAMAADQHAGWAARAAAAYGDGDLHDALVSALLDRLSNARSRVTDGNSSKNSRLPGDCSHALRRIMLPADRPRLLALLDRPTGPEPEQLQTRLAYLIAFSGDAAVVKEVFLPRLQSHSVPIRLVSLRVLAEVFGKDRHQLTLLDSGFEVPSEEEALGVARRILDSARRDAEPSVRLEALRMLGQMGMSLPPAEAAPVFRAVLDDASADAKLRKSAIESLGRLRQPDDAERLLALFDDADESVRVAAAPAAAACARSDPALAKRVVERLARQVEEHGHRQWRPSVAALRGIATIGDAAAIDVLLHLSRSPNIEERVRSLAISQICGAGAPALPTLLRLCFDEEETGSHHNGRRLRTCDRAAHRLDVLLGGEFGFDKGRGKKECDRVLERIRAEATRRGLKPLPPRPPALPR